MLVKNLDKIHPSDCPILAQVRGQYAPRRCHYNNGYIHYTINGKATPEHRLVAECIYGPLSSDQIVHHRDECRTNNSASNLTVMTRAEHVAEHRGQQAVLTCPICGQPFGRKPSDLANVNFCSTSCRARADQRIEWPDAETLAAMIADADSWLAVGRVLGVSDNAVRKRARRYGII